MKLHDVIFWDGKVEDRRLVNLVIVLITALVMGMGIVLSMNFSEVQMAQIQNPSQQAALVVLR